MKTMKAIAVTDIGKVEVVDDVPMPEPGEYEALARIHACGFCNGTDFHIIEGQLEEKAGFKGFPAILGHEAAGEVVRVGKKVRNIKVGDRYINPMLREEVGNGYHKTWSGMAEYGLVADKRAMCEDGVPYDPAFEKQGPFPEAIDYIDAGVLLSLSECQSAAKNFGAGRGMDVLMYGAGPMGIALAMFVKMRGVATLTQIDQDDSRLERAVKTAKADRVINFATQNLDEALKGRHFDMVIDAVGKSSILIEGSRRLRPEGTGKVCSLGVLAHDDRMIDASLIKDNTSLHMLNFPYGEYDVMPETADLILKGTVNPKDFYSHVLPFTEIAKVLELVKTRQAIKIVLTF
ncbi:MAG: alcohol dehydrogenase catalytic domain-containing protein [Planctomycetota bacterium]|nr:alcohol dehydrogenase catalytic domain-containing protein [Planctomycetota bacterium]